MYLVPSEIFPMVIRSSGMSFSIIGQFVAAATLLEAALTAYQNIGYWFWVILILLDGAVWDRWLISSCLR